MTLSIIIARFTFIKMPKKRKRSRAAANSPAPAYIDDDANGQLSLSQQIIQVEPSPFLKDTFPAVQRPRDRSSGQNRPETDSWSFSCRFSPETMVQTFNFAYAPMSSCSSSPKCFLPFPWSWLWRRDLFFFFEDTYRFHKATILRASKIANRMCFVKYKHTCA